MFSRCHTKLQNSRERQTPYFKRKPRSTLSKTVWKRHEGLFIKLPCRVVVTLWAESVMLKCFLIQKLPGQSKYTVWLQQVVLFWAVKGLYELLQNMQMENRVRWWCTNTILSREFTLVNEKNTRYKNRTNIIRMDNRAMASRLRTQDQRLLN